MRREEGTGSFEKGKSHSNKYIYRYAYSNRNHISSCTSCIGLGAKRKVTGENGKVLHNGWTVFSVSNRIYTDRENNERKGSDSYQCQRRYVYSNFGSNKYSDHRCRLYVQMGSTDIHNFEHFSIVCNLYKESKNK